MENIGSRIGLFLSMNHMTKVSFAAKLNINQSYVTKIVNGKQCPSDRLIEDICEKFRLNREWLTTGKGEMYVHEEEPADMIARLAAEHKLGSGGTALLRAAVRIMQELGPEALDRIIAETLPGIMPEASAEISPADEARALYSAAERRESRSS